MAARFATNLTLLLASAFALVATFAMTRAADVWILFSLGCLAALLALWGFGLRDRGASQRALDVITAISGAFLIVASRAFSPGTMRWLGFSLAAALLALALAGLLIREIVLVRHHALPRPAR